MLIDERIHVRTGRILACDGHHQCVYGLQCLLKTDDIGDLPDVGPAPLGLEYEDSVLSRGKGSANAWRSPPPPSSDVYPRGGTRAAG